MKKRFLFIFLSASLLLFNCTKEKAQNNTELLIDPPEEIIIEDQKLTGICTADNLRIRNQPLLDSGITGHLMKNDVVEVLSQSWWTEEINGIDSSWLEIKTAVRIGWVFGGYMTVTGEIPVNVKMIKESSSYFYSGTAVDLSLFPNQYKRPFGIEDFYDVENPEETRIEGAFGGVIIVNSPIPQKSVAATLTSSKGTTFERDPGKGFPSITYDNPDYPVMYIPLTRTATYPSDTWKLEISIDGGEAISETINWSREIIRVSDTQNPNPFHHKWKMTASLEQILYVFLSSLTPQTNYYLVLYKEEYKDSDPDNNYFPVNAIVIPSDDRGMIQTKLQIGTDAGEGWYKIGYGTNPENIEIYDFSNGITIQ